MLRYHIGRFILKSRFFCWLGLHVWVTEMDHNEDTGVVMELGVSCFACGKMR